MDDLLKLKKMIDELVEKTEDLGSERVQPYVCILKGIQAGIDVDVESE